MVLVVGVIPDFNSGDTNRIWIRNIFFTITFHYKRQKMKIRFVSRQEIVDRLLDKLIQNGSLDSDDKKLLAGLTSGK